jgi:hypothetical protein
MTRLNEGEIREAINEIINRVSEGESVHMIIKHNKDKYPTFSTFYKYINNNKDIEKAYLSAKQIGLEKRAQEIEEIADEEIEYNDNAAVQKQKLRIDTRKWLLSKLAPRKYGDKLDLNHGGQDGNPVITKIERVIIDPK